MSEQDIRLECLKLASGMVSRTVADLQEEIIITAEVLYKYVNSGMLNSQGMDTPRTEPVKRGRPPKHRSE